MVKPFDKERIYSVLGELSRYLTENAEKEAVIQLKGEDGPLLLSLKNIYAFEYTGNRRITVYTKSEKYRIKGSRFRDCAHLCEKGCAVVEAVERGEISRSRHESYKTMYEEAKQLKEWELK